MSEEYEDQTVFEAAKAEARKLYGGMELLAQIRKMRDLQAEKEKLDGLLKIINAHYDVIRMETIPEKMDEDGVENMRVEGIGRVSLTADMFVATTNKQGLFQWFREQHLGDMIQDTVNASTLKAFVKRRMKEGKDVPSDYLRVTPFTRASITKG